ncbi:MAG: toprim domain-containing protein [Terriglobales bacterium]
MARRIVVCEGEFDRLALESRGFAAVTSTAGTLTFRREWADALRRFREVLICFGCNGRGGIAPDRLAATGNAPRHSAGGRRGRRRRDRLLRAPGAHDR